MNKLFQIFLLICILSLSLNVYSQDFHLSQFYTAPVVFNPAEVGMMDGDYRASSSYRDQWRTLGNAYTTQQVSLDSKILKDKSGGNLLSAGFSYLGDRAGVGRLGYWMISGKVSTSIKVGEDSRVSFGLKGGYGTRSVNMGAFSWDNQWNGVEYNSGLPSGEGALIPKGRIIDFGAGAFFIKQPTEYFSFNFGLALDHFLKPQITYIAGTSDRLKMKLTGTFGADVKVKGTNKTILPKLLIMKQGPNYEVTPGVLFRYGLGMESRYTGIYRQSAIYFGGFYRTRDAIVLSMMYDHKRYFSFGLSYDINLSRLTPSTYTMGGFEITLTHVGLFSEKTSAVSRN